MPAAESPSADSSDTNATRGPRSVATGQGDEPSSGRASTGTSTGGPNRPGLPFGFRATVPATNRPAASTRVGSASKGWPLATAMSAPVHDDLIEGDDTGELAGQVLATALSQAGPCLVVAPGRRQRRQPLRDARTPVGPEL